MKLLDGVLVVLVLILSVILFSVSRTNKQLRSTPRQAVMARQVAFVPEFEATTLEGQPISLGRSSVLLVFNTTCPHCRRSLPAWRILYDSLATELVVVGVSLDNTILTETYVDQHDLRFPVVTMEGPREKYLFGLGPVPQLLVVNDSGRVIYSRVGSVDAHLALDSVLVAIRSGSALAAGR